MNNRQTVLVLDFGGQYKELIARSIRSMKVASFIKRGDTPIDEIKVLSPIGIVLTGGPDSVYADGSPKCDPALFSLGIPILGICYGAQLMAYMLGGSVESCESSEYGDISVGFDRESPLFSSLPECGNMLMSHTDRITRQPNGFTIRAFTDKCPIAAMENLANKLFAVQFHPEVERSEFGRDVLHSFVYDICGALGDYTMADYEAEQIKLIRETIGGDGVLLGLSGGVDSSVAAALLSKAVPGQLTCIFVDHGLMRKNEGDEIEAVFSDRPVNFIRVNAADRFLSQLKGVEDPEAKRKIIGKLFIDTFEEQAKKLTNIKYLAQGTIYPDVIESGANNSATIKSHHNVGGLPDYIDFKGLVEPLRGLFKDEVRSLGRRLGLPDLLVDRQPFPGPGLAIRIIGEVTEDKLAILRECDAIFREEMARDCIKSDQYFAALTNIRSVGVMGDFRTYDYCVALRAVKTSDFMTCEYTRVPYETLDRVSTRIVNEVGHVNRVMFDITGKPPATIEYE